MEKGPLGGQVGTLGGQGRWGLHMEDGVLAGGQAVRHCAHFQSLCPSCFLYGSRLYPHQCQVSWTKEALCLS